MVKHFSKAHFKQLATLLFHKSFNFGFIHATYQSSFDFESNPFPAKSFVPLVKIASKNSLSENFRWPEVFVSKTLLQFRVHKSWELKQEVIRRPTDMQEPLCEGHQLTS